MFTRIRPWLRRLAALSLCVFPLLSQAENLPVPPGASNGSGGLPIPSFLAPAALLPLPNLGSFLGSDGILDQPDYSFQDRTWDVWYYAMPDTWQEDVDQWLRECEAAGYRWTRVTMNGYPAYTVEGMERQAILFPDYYQRIMLMTESGMLISPYFSLADAASVTPSVMNGEPAHTISIYAPDFEGEWLRIEELDQLYQVGAGFLTFSLPDYSRYTDADAAENGSVSVTLTVCRQDSQGAWKSLGQIEYQISVPLSPLILQNPSTLWAETSLPLFSLQFRVKPGSAVQVNGSDVSDQITEDGAVTCSVPIQAVGDNLITVTVQAPHCQTNTQTVTIYREPQEIPLDLYADEAYQVTHEDRITVRGVTSPQAAVTVRSRHEGLDVSRLPIDGSFSFQAVFNKIGANAIVVEAAKEGAATSTVQIDVYYVPPASVYTLKAWDMSAQYKDYLNNASMRIANAQIYLCRGTVAEVLSDQPQLVLFQLSDDPERLVLIGNQTGDSWEAGKEYRIYGDAYGVYNGLPWLMGRYAYDLR